MKTSDLRNVVFSLVRRLGKFISNNIIIIKKDNAIIVNLIPCSLPEYIRFLTISFCYSL